ncbi:hypothetical protein GCM10022247_35580 [Allokutzneria multivorans]|uniref:Uncharacterized protein n=1 Tax=Allokutzneria multivorans TaxID=1142134 RepID=A0ABP7SDJ6_9PSEU
MKTPVSPGSEQVALLRQLSQVCHDLLDHLDPTALVADEVLLAAAETTPAVLEVIDALMTRLATRVSTPPTPRFGDMWSSRPREQHPVWAHQRWCAVARELADRAADARVHVTGLPALALALPPHEPAPARQLPGTRVQRPWPCSPEVFAGQEESVREVFSLWQRYNPAGVLSVGEACALALRPAAQVQAAFATMVELGLAIPLSGEYAVDTAEDIPDGFDPPPGVDHGAALERAELFLIRAAQHASTLLSPPWPRLVQDLDLPFDIDLDTYVADTPRRARTFFARHRTTLCQEAERALREGSCDPLLILAATEAVQPACDTPDSSWESAISAALEAATLVRRHDARAMALLWQGWFAWHAATANPVPETPLAGEVVITANSRLASGTFALRRAAALALACGHRDIADYALQALRNPRMRPHLRPGTLPIPAAIGEQLAASANTPPEDASHPLALIEQADVALLAGEFDTAHRFLDASGVPEAGADRGRAMEIHARLAHIQGDVQLATQCLENAFDAYDTAFLPRARDVSWSLKFIRDGHTPDWPL